MTTSKEKYKKAIKVNNTSTSTAHVDQTYYYSIIYPMIVHAVASEANGDCTCVWVGGGGLGLSEILTSKKENDYDDSYF